MTIVSNKTKWQHVEYSPSMCLLAYESIQNRRFMALKSSRFYKIDWKIMQNSSQTSCNKRQGTVASCSTLWASRLFSVRWTPIPDPMQVAMNKAHLHFISKRGMVNNWKCNSYFDIVIMLDPSYWINIYMLLNDITSRDKRTNWLSTFLTVTPCH